MSHEVSIQRVGIHSWRAQCLLISLWALFGAMSYPSPNFWLLAYLTPLPLVILAMRGASARRTMTVIGCGAVVWWCWMLRWMMPVTVPGAIGLGCYTALFTLGFAATLRHVARQSKWPMVILLPLIWTAFEYVRGALIVGGFPWFGLGHSQPAVVIQIADAVGAYGVSFFVAMASGLLYDMLTCPLVEHRDGQRRWGVPIRWSWPIWAVALSFVLVYGGWAHLADRSCDGSSIRVGARGRGADECAPVEQGFA